LGTPVRDARRKEGNVMGGKLEMSTSVAWLLLLLANLFWAGNYIFGKYVTAEVEPLTITVLRWLIAIVLMFPIAHRVENPDWRRVATSWWPLVWLGLFGVVGYNIPLYAALAYTTPTNAALVNSLNPALIVLGSAMLLRERFTLLQTVGFFVSLIGVLVILTGADLSQLLHAQFNRGDLLMLVAILSWTAYSIIAKTLTGIPPISATAVSSLLGTLLLLLFVPFVEWQWQPMSGLAWSGILYMAIFPSIGSYILWNVAVRRLGASQAGITLHLIPVFTALFALLTGDGITFAQIAGGLLVCVGVTFTTGLGNRWLQTLRKQSQTGLNS
jgi:drug/metabolite transporter (DMT)-like permease